MKRLMRLAAAGLVLGAGVAPAALAQGSPQSSAQGPSTAGEAAFRATTLALSAYGEVKLAPDQATISLGVTTDAATAQAAMQANAQQMGQVLAALRGAGVAVRDVQTAQIGVEPQYAYEQNLPPRLTGYRATDQLSVTVRDLARLGATVDAAVSAGANQAGGVSFGLADPTAAEDAARGAAVKALTAKAQLYAQATGYRLLRLVSLQEGGGGGMPSAPMPMAAARFEKAETPVAPGELRVRIDVTGLYELAR